MTWLANGAFVSPQADSSTPKLTVESVGNHVYFYSGVDSDRCLALVKSLREIDVSLRNEALSRGIKNQGNPVPIWLHVQSGGGSLHAAFAISDQLGMIETPIYSVVEGYAASAATVIAMSCTKRYILPSAFMLIHQLSSMAWGKYEEIKDETHICDMAMELLADFYVRHSKMKLKRVQELLRRDSWFKAKECVELGLADSILT